MSEHEEFTALVMKNFNAKKPSEESATVMSWKNCGGNCGPCNCPGGNICAFGVGGSAESVGYAGGTAGDMSTR